jgi:glucokinase
VETAKDGTTILGIDVGGTKIAGGVVDAQSGHALLSERVPTLAGEGGRSVLARALALARSLSDAAAAQGLPAPAAVGVGAGGQIDPATGSVVSATDVLPGWGGTRLRDAFEDALSLPVAVDNDVNALATGEGRFGAGKGYAHLVYLALGTGVGGALIVEGRLHHGASGAGGELGHLVLFPDGLPCTCGGRGCLEQYANGAALVRHWREAGDDAALRIEMNLPEEAPLAAVDGPQIAQTARRVPGGLAARAVGRTGEMLGLGLVSLANLFDPDRIIIGGGLAALGDALLEPARRVLGGRALPPVRACPVVPAALGADAAVIGAAALALGTIRRSC